MPGGSTAGGETDGGVKHADIGKLLDRYRITDGASFRLKDHDPADRGEDPIGDGKIEKWLADGIERLSDLQTKLFADDRWSLLVVLQAMDAAGKDGTIKHVMTGINPQGVEVSAFKQPGPNDLSHGFLWRVHMRAPTRGRIAIFNRSHYEDVLVCRVHPHLLDPLHLPPEISSDPEFWQRRLADIAAFEAYLANQGTVVLKFFLNVSKHEQKRRFLKRLDKPKKNWKFSSADLQEREFWDAYQDAYEAAIKATALPRSPWFVVPADDKDFTHFVVAEAMIEALERLDLKIPVLSKEEMEKLGKARETLEKE
jgi:PPK2 family polyphosphate:nucleotide phosphotransferase